MKIIYIRKFQSFFDENVSESVLHDRIEKYFQRKTKCLNESLRAFPDEEKYIDVVETIVEFIIKTISDKNSSAKHRKIKLDLFENNKVTNKNIYIEYSINFINLSKTMIKTTNYPIVSSNVISNNDNYVISLMYAGTKEDAFIEITKEILHSLVDIFNIEHNGKLKQNFIHNPINQPNYIIATNNILRAIDKNKIRQLENNLIYFVKSNYRHRIFTYKDESRLDTIYNKFKETFDYENFVIIPQKSLSYLKSITSNMIFKS